MFKMDQFMSALLSVGAASLSRVYYL
jgi:hypothetical protein